MLITSRDNNRIKHLRKLLNKKESNIEKLFIIEGDNLVTEAIKNNLLVELYLLDGERNKYNFECNYVTLDVMKSISSLNSTPRVIGVSKYINKNRLGNKILLLDDIQDPGNAGTIIRNSVAFGIDTVVFSKNSVNPYNEKVLRSTGGMIYNVNIIIDDLETVLKEIKANSIKVLGTSLKSSNPLKNIEILDKFAIIFGNEGNGVSDRILNYSDETIRIEMEKDCESLNVGVSSGIILYHMYRGNK